MTILVVGATGATGRLLVEQLLARGRKVHAVVRSPDKLPDALRNHPSLSLVQASLLDLRGEEMTELVAGCSAVASCLGHNMSLKGIYGAPRRLVADATRRLCEAITATRPSQPVRFVLMNTAGNREPDLDEPVSWRERAAVGLGRALLPPQVDNEEAAAELRRRVGEDAGGVEWVVVRPDSLVDAKDAGDYEVHASPTRSAILDPGRTSRLNVARFMAELLCDDATWSRWRGQMPVIYDKGFS